MKPQSFDIYFYKTKNSFDILAFKELSSIIQVLIDKVSRKDKNIVNLYNQDERKMRIAHYFRRCLRWCVIVATCYGIPTFGAEISQSCNAIAITNGNLELLYPDAPASLIVNSGFIGTTINPNPTISNPITICYTTLLPDTDDTSCEGSSIFVVPADTEFYIHMVNSGTLPDTRCSYGVTWDSNNPAMSTSRIVTPIAASSTDVPVFTPLGLVTTIGGLLWYGRRRKVIKLTQD